MIISNISILNKFLSGYEKIYGPHTKYERIIRKLLNKEYNINTNSSIYLVALGDGSLFNYLVQKIKCKFYAYDINQKNIEFSVKNFGRADIIIKINQLDDVAKGDILICNNILNSLSEEECYNFLSGIKNKYKHFIFTGEKVKCDRNALGPEPAGSYGCKQYCTDNIGRLLKFYFINVKEYSYFPDKYLYYI